MAEVLFWTHKETGLHRTDLKALIRLKVKEAEGLVQQEQMPRVKQRMCGVCLSCLLNVLRFLLL